jgi:DNA-directed RNA polymerase specialized sigma24 family protein
MKPNHVYAQALAIARLRQWLRDRNAAAAGAITNYARVGWRARRASEADARIVRMIDFERALDSLPDEQKLALIFHYAQGETCRDAARLIGCSERKMSYLIPTARLNLTEILDRQNLL